MLVDHLEFPLPGFIGQMKGRLTRSRYQVATVFVDHHSDLSYVYLQRSTTGEETVNAKSLLNCMPGNEESKSFTAIATTEGSLTIIFSNMPTRKVTRYHIVESILTSRTVRRRKELEICRKV